MLTTVTSVIKYRLLGINLINENNYENIKNVSASRSYYV